MDARVPTTHPRTYDKVLMLGLVTHSGEAFRCVNMDQTGYNDTIRRELIWENLTKVILDSKLMHTIMGGDMNTVSPGGRDGCSQRKSSDDDLRDFSKKIGTL
jgi:hypothetical protein